MGHTILMEMGNGIGEIPHEISRIQSLDFLGRRIVDAVLASDTIDVEQLSFVGVFENENSVIFGLIINDFE